MRLIKNLNGSGVADTCGGRRAGDGKCEQACGADSKCDELNTGNFCGTNGRCTTNCSCCEPSDSDGGRNYTVKGTTTGTYFEAGVGEICKTYSDHCVEGNDYQLIEYYIDNGWMGTELYKCNQRTDGLVHCVDGKCGCTSDNDCKDANGNYRYDPVSHTKIVCDCPSASCSRHIDNDYTCKPKPSCSIPEDCEDTWCCDTITGAKDCKSRGTILNVGGKSYLCDPPEGFVSSASKKLSLLDFLLKFNPFS